MLVCHLRFCLSQLPLLRRLARPLVVLIRVNVRLEWSWVPSPNVCQLVLGHPVHPLTAINAMQMDIFRLNVERLVSMTSLRSGLSTASALLVVFVVNLPWLVLDLLLIIFLPPAASVTNPPTSSFPGFQFDLYDHEDMSRLSQQLPLANKTDELKPLLDPCTRVVNHIQRDDAGFIRFELLVDNQPLIVLAPPLLVSLLVLTQVTMRMTRPFS